METGAAPAITVIGRRNRGPLVRRAKLLARLGLAWHGIEAAVAIGAGVVAGSIALIGFGADSLIEMLAGGFCFGAMPVRGPTLKRPSTRRTA